MGRMDQLYSWAVDFSVAMDPGVSTYRRATYQLGGRSSHCISGNSGVVANPLRFTVCALSRIVLRADARKSSGSMDSVPERSSNFVNAFRPKHLRQDRTVT